MPASEPDSLAVSSVGQRGDEGGGTNCGQTPQRVEQGAGRPDDVISGVGVYKR